MKISEQKLRESFRNGELATKLPIIIYDTIGSTNTEAKEYAKSASVPYALFIANGQTAGRGRLGRSFISGHGTGLYMSLLVALDKSIADAVSVTAYTAVIVKRALYELYGIYPSIKWVNDIILSDKKLAGILTEGILEPGTDKLKYAVIGIGLNVSGKALPEEIKDIATTLEMCGVSSASREEIAARICELFLRELDKIGTVENATEYRSASCIIGKEVNVIKPHGTYVAKVLDITDKCELVLELPMAKTEILSAGEVSIRPTRVK